MSVPVQTITDDRLRRWLADCVRDNATPIALVAVGHDQRSGEVHVYRTEDGPTDIEIGALIGQVAVRMMRSEVNSS